MKKSICSNIFVKQVYFLNDDVRGVIVEVVISCMKIVQFIMI